jgi:pimeloyl-ACP methyl ester carboxylesterase
MQRKKKQNLGNLSSKHRNGAIKQVENQKLDAGEEKLDESGVGNGLNSSEQNGVVTSDVSCNTEAGTRGLVKSLCGITFIGVLKVVVLVIVVPPFLNYASLQRESASLRPHGEMHDGPRGNKLFMNCSGKGLPVVMMDTPGGYSSDVWLSVQAKVSKFTKVCIYDRAGLGFSGRATPRFSDNQHGNMSSGIQDFKYEQLRPTTENMVADIHHLLETMSNSTIDVLLVGGGLGSINARFYASFYENIFGIVLINPFHESTFMDKDWDMFWYEHFVPSLQMEQLSAAFGLNRLGIITGLYKPSILKEGRFDNEVLIRLKHLSCNSQHLSAGVMEHYYMNESLAQLKILEKLKPFPNDISVSLISSQKFSDNLPQSLNKLWFKSQELFARELSPKSEQVIVDSDFNAVYFSHVDVIVTAIKKLVHKFRKSVKQSAKI